LCPASCSCFATTTAALLPCFAGSREAAASLLPAKQGREAALKGDAVPCCAEGKAQQGKAQNSIELFCNTISFAI